MFGWIDDDKWWHEDDVKRGLKNAYRDGYHAGYESAMNLLGKKYEEQIKFMEQLVEVIKHFDNKLDNINHG